LVTRFDYNKQAKSVSISKIIALYDYDSLIFIAFYGILKSAKAINIMANFGDNLKDARTKKGISQSQLAELMGIHPAHISRYERNQTVPSIDVVKKFADLLEVTTDMLVYGGEDEKAKDRIIDNELLTMFSKAQTLNDEDRKCVKSFLKAFLFQKDMQKQLV
jgi:transcriptional regulator with XRE-family HTH domain